MSKTMPASLVVAGMIFAGPVWALETPAAPAAPPAPSAPVAAQPGQVGVSIGGTYVRGLKYYATAEILGQMKVGQELQLVRDPKNQFDPNAISVVDPVSNRMLGYVARDISAQLAPALDAGKVSLQAAVVKIEPPSQASPVGGLLISIQSVNAQAAGAPAR